MSALASHRHWHIPGLAYARAHPTQMLLLWATAAAFLIVAGSVVGALFGFMHPAMALFVVGLTIGLGYVLVRWRYDVLKARIVERIVPISSSEIRWQRNKDEDTQLLPVVRPSHSTTYVPRSHPVDNELAMDLMRDLETDTGDLSTFRP